MGVKHFYYWYRRQLEHCVQSKINPHVIDILCLDMNGIFHTCAQHVFKYGMFEIRVPDKPNTLLGRKIVANTNYKRLTPNKIRQLCQEICEKVNHLVQSIRPNKALVLCVDGVAGLGKMNQQRQRRFRAVWNTEVNQLRTTRLEKDEFHSNMLTPGTKLMDEITKYLDSFIRQKQETDVHWKSVQVIYSNEKVPGEGEHKIMNYVRKYGKKEDCVGVYGLDADLVMLGLLLPCSQVFILREAYEGQIETISISLFRQSVLDMMKWSDRHHTFSTSQAIADFVLLCFLVGNDFLPTLSSLTIIDGAVPFMMHLYRQIGKEHGHMTFFSKTHNMWKLRTKPLSFFFQELAIQEPLLYIKKYRNTSCFVPDPLVLDCLQINHDEKTESIDWIRFQNEYIASHFPSNVSMESITRQYLDGMVWVLNYYTKGMPDWTWFFPYLYAPFATHFISCLEKYQSPTFELHRPVPSFLQLLMVLPPCHSSLLPHVFEPIIHHPSSSLQYAFPQKIVLDMYGKRKEWEAIVCLPPLSLHDFDFEYQKIISKILPMDQKRNQIGKQFLYDSKNTCPKYIQF